TNLARSSLAFWSLRRILGGAKSSVLVNLFTICPPMRPVASRPRPNSVPDHGHLMACFTVFRLGRQNKNNACGAKKPRLGGQFLEERRRRRQRGNSETGGTGDLVYDVHRRGRSPLGKDQAR